MTQLHLSRIVEQARRDHGPQLAALCGDLRLSYHQLYERALRLANGLHGLGVAKGDRVAVLMLNCHRYLELYLAAALSGIVIVPLNVRWGAQEFSHALMDSTPKVFAIDRTVYDKLQPYLGALQGMGIAHFLFADQQAPEGTLDYEALLAGATTDPITETLGEDDLYGLFYTSGTTGNPKGVMLTHRNVFTNAYHAQTQFQFQPGTIFLHAAPMFHLADGAATFTLTWNGGTHAFVPRFEEEAVFQAIARYKVTASVMVPTMINFLVRHPARMAHDLSSFQHMIYGASPMPLEVLKAAAEAFGCEFLQGYGMTEAAPLVTALNERDHRQGLLGKHPQRLHSAGRPIPGVEVRVVDEQGRDAPAGEVGEVWVRGPNVMKGYWNLPEETAAVLDGAGWYRSRDMGRLDEAGYLTLVDRKGDMIVSGGENVYSTEVEDAIYRHEAVLEACVVGVPDPQWVEAVCAVVVRKPEAELDEAALIAHCKRELSPYKVPKRVAFVDELPKGGTGKVLKHVVRAQQTGA